MRALSELITDATLYANVEKSPKFSESVFIRLFNAAQRQLRMIIHNAYPTEPILAKIVEYTIVSGQTYITLPTDMLTPNSIHNVTPKRTGGTYGESIKRVSLIERGNTQGYYITNNKLYMSPGNYFQNFIGTAIEVTYASEVADFAATTDVSELPTVCEEYLILWVERKINAIKSSKDLPSSKVFSDEERQDLVDLFADSARDPKTPPITNPDYVVY
jgi:hypothetical protein